MVDAYTYVDTDELYSKEEGKHCTDIFLHISRRKRKAIKIYKLKMFFRIPDVQILSKHFSTIRIPRTSVILFTFVLFLSCKR